MGRGSRDPVELGDVLAVHRAPRRAAARHAAAAGSHEQKAKNLQSNPRCILAGGANQFRSGLDVVIEGTAARVTGPAQLQRLAAMWKSKLDWDFQVNDDGFRDPAGRTGLVFGVKPAKILAFGKSPYSQTRYRFTT
jgi:hypothetical protein